MAHRQLSFQRSRSYREQRFSRRRNGTVAELEAQMSIEHWQTEDEFTLDELACLIVGVDPLAKHVSPHGHEGKINLLGRQLDRDYRHEASRLINAVLKNFHPQNDEEPELHSPSSISWSIKGNDGIRSKNYDWARNEVITSSMFTDITCASDVEDLCYPVDLQKFTREEVARWCAKRGWQSKFDFSDKGHSVRWHDDNHTRVAASSATAGIVTPNLLGPEVSPRAKNNYEALIAAMAMKHYQYDASDAKSEVPAKLEILLENRGVALTAQTIRGYLQRGAERLGKQK